MKKLVFALISLALLTTAALAQQEDDDASTPGPEACPRLQASTIFIPDKTGNRQKGSAKRISETHDTAEAQGWDFDDMEIYIEDGDLQGFFMTYTRPHPCNNK